MITANPECQPDRGQSPSRDHAGRSTPSWVYDIDKEPPQGLSGDEREGTSRSTKCQARPRPPGKWVPLHRIAWGAGAHEELGRRAVSVLDELNFSRYT